MLKSILTLLAVAGFVAAPLHADTKKVADDAKKTVEKAADKVADKVKKATDDKKTAEVSESDKALQAHAEKEAAGLSAAQKEKLLTLANTGKDDELATMPGIGETKAAAIKKARPVKTVESLIMVDGIGESTFDGIVKWTKDGMPAKDAAKPEEKKDDKKPAAKKADAKPADAKADDKAAPKKTTKKAADEKAADAKTEEKPADDTGAKKTTKKTK